MTLLNFLRRTSECIDTFVYKIVFVTIFGMILAISLQIIFRVFFDSLTWTEELARYLLVWSTFLGATLAYKRGMHIAVTFLRDIFSKKIKRGIIIFSLAVIFVFCVVVIFFGIKLMVLQSVQLSPALRLPMRWVYLVLPASFAVIAIYNVTELLEQLLNTREAGEQ